MKEISPSVPMRERVWIMYGHKCLLCGRFMKLEDVTLDHILPKSKGGRNRIENYAPAHAACNTLKSDKVTEKHVLYGIKMAEKFGYKTLDQQIESKSEEQRKKLLEKAQKRSEKLQNVIKNIYGNKQIKKKKLNKINASLLKNERIAERILASLRGNTYEKAT